MSERVLQYDLDAEGAVLSACMLSADALSEVVPWLKSQDFFSEANRRVYEAILAVDGGGDPVDVVMVANKLRSQERLTHVGGAAYLALLTDATPSVANIAAHAKRLSELAQVRTLQKVCQKIAADGYGGIEDVGAWLSKSEGAVFDAVHQDVFKKDTLCSLAEATTAEFKALGERSRGTDGQPGASTGLRALDHVMGRLYAGNLYVLAARPGMGKTALAWKVAVSVASQGKAVVFVSVEMPTPQLMQRGLCQCSGVNALKIASGKLDSREWTAVVNATRDLGRLPVMIDDAPGHTLISIRAAIRRSLSRLKQKHGKDMELGLVVVDYLQRLRGERHRGDSKNDEVGDLSRGHMDMAKEFNVPVLLLSQLNRAVESRDNKRPRPSDLRDSGAIEQDAYGIMFVYREDAYRRDREPHDGAAEIIVAKNRNGRTGTARVRFDAESTRFYDDPSCEDGVAAEFEDVGDEYFAA